MSLEAIEKAICEAGSDNHEVFGGTWTGGYLIQQDPKEFAELVECLQKHEPFDNALSIGIAAGGNERFICENVDIANLTVIDNGKHPAHKYWSNNRKVVLTSRKIIRSRVEIREFILDSHSSGAKLALEVNHSNFKFNLVGIDGDHSPEGVLQDWELVQPYLAPGAIVWLHDIRLNIPGQHGARKLWVRLNTQYEVLLETDGRFGIGVLRVN